MGSSHSQEELVNMILESLGDISIDDNLLKYSGVNSAAVLEDHTSMLIRTTQDVGNILTTIQGVPNAVGLGALVISMFLNIAVGSSGNDGGNTAEILSRVIAKEKAVAVRDTMNEYLNRLHMYMREPVKAREETMRLEKQLSEQLTRLRNSILDDDQLDMSAYRWWVNGAAFHSQMVIHSARLETTDKILGGTELENRVATADSVVNRHYSDLQQLLTKIRTSLMFPDQWIPLFDNWDQAKRLRSYFLELRENTRELINQHDTFKVPSDRNTLWWRFGLKPVVVH